ncbi:Transmembrane protein 53-B [Holothuria leucospilota]|uniref:Transmembrane protein 53-B n=1 Tax=Holothuria leucospilota TaxID=206669 RepID=A0A9Q0YJZ7_HOLLE|nr:Transmembrane protein 53-B [Holothuria leucospilota]
MLSTLRQATKKAQELSRTKSVSHSAIRSFASNLEDKQYQKKKVDENITLELSNSPETLDQANRPLVLILSWLAAKQQHISKFSRLYLGSGCDVLVVKLNTAQLLLPKKGVQKVAENVVNIIQKEEFKERPLLVYGFSTGGYFYSEIIQKMQQAEKVRGEITNRIMAQIYDSVADLPSIPEGISKALLKHGSFQQRAMSKCIEGYMNVMERPATQYYRKGSRIFHHNPVNAPTLFIYSKNDPVGSATQNEAAVNSLRCNMGYDNIYTKVFENSPHVSHMYKHREEYMATLKWFLDKLEYFRERFTDEEWGRIVRVMEKEKK